MSGKSTFFDPKKNNEAEFNRDVLPLLEAVSELCAYHGILYVACFQYSDEDMYKMTALSDNGCKSLAAMEKVISPINRSSRDDGGECN